MDKQQAMPVEEPIQPDEQATEQVENEIINESDVEMSPAQQQQLDAYKDNATLVVFSEKSQAAILQSLQSGENPVKSVANTAVLVHKKLSESIDKTKEKMTEITICLGAAHLVSELIVLGEAAGLFEMSQQDKLESFRQAVMKYFADGLADGSIDPVKLQETIEPLMNKDQKDAGLQAMNQHGVLKTKPPANGMYRPAQQRQQEQAPSQQAGILGGNYGR